jgi:hypothetical protein
MLALGQSQRAMVYEVSCPYSSAQPSVRLHLNAPVSCSAPPPSSSCQGSFLDFDWADGDVVFANSTCFDDALMLSLSEAVSAPPCPRILLLASISTLLCVPARII